MEFDGLTTKTQRSKGLKNYALNSVLYKRNKVFVFSFVTLRLFYG